MFQNNNNNIIFELSGKCYRQNKKRNILTILSITMTTFMIISILNIGIAYINSFELQQKQLLGTTGDALLENPTREQIEILKNHNMIDTCGMRLDILNIGSLSLDFYNTGLYYAFRYYDEIEWEEHRIPVLENIVGNYPEEENEIMFPLWALKKMGIEEPQIGMKFNFTYEINNKINTAEFVLSGYFNEFDNNVKEGSIVYVLISKDFIENNKIQTNQVKETADISLRKENFNTLEMERLIADLRLDKNQKFSINPDYGQQFFNLELISILFVLVFAILCCGFLLIYNIFYIFAKNNIQFYGQLKALGITQKQITALFLIQSLKLGAIGISIGLLLGIVLSLAAIPFLLSIILEQKTGIVIEFKCWVIVGTIIFSFITVLIATLKPAKIVGKISPIEALKHIDVRETQIKKIKSKDNTVYHMAIRNIFVDKKKTSIVTLSLFLGILSCMLVTMLISSMNINNYLDNIIESDFEMKNRTAALGYTEGIKEVFNTEFLNQLQRIDGIKEIYEIKQSLIAPVYSEEVFGNYIIKELNLMGEDNSKSEVFRKQPEIFYSQLIGIDTETIETILSEQNINSESFENGEICLIAQEEGIFKIGDMIEYKLASPDKAGKVIIKEEKNSLKIGGFLPSKYNNLGILRSLAPYIFVSNKAIETLADNIYITNLRINVEKNKEKFVLEELSNITKKNGNIIFISSLERAESLRKTKITLYSLGAGLAGILVFIGILNYANVIFTGINARKKELTIMECVGVTKKQLILILQLEGLCYIVISVLLTLTIGNIIIFIVYKLFENIVAYAVFEYPFKVFFLLTFVFLVLNFFLPKIALKKSTNSTIIERLKENE